MIYHTIFHVLIDIRLKFKFKTFINNIWANDFTIFLNHCKINNRSLLLYQISNQYCGFKILLYTNRNETSIIRAF